PRGDQYQVAVGTQLAVGAPGVLANDIVNGSAPRAVLVSAPGFYSRFNLNPDGSFTYTPTAGFSGLDSFRYRITDGADASAADSNVAAVTLTRTDPVRVDGGNLDVVGSSGTDVIRLTPAGRAIRVEMHTPLGDLVRVATPPIGVSKFVQIDVTLKSGNDVLS